MIAVIDYNIGNVGSVINALNKLGIPNQISNDPAVLRNAKGLILPGVGAARQGMKNLKKLNLDKIIVEEVKKGKPFLGICLGMQLLFEKSEEGNVTCLGIFEGTVKKFKKERKIPQIGWNDIQIQNSKFKIQNDNAKLKSLFNKIPNQSYFYFVNSFYCAPTDQSIILGKSVYGEEFASIVGKENVLCVQFHPEKSGKVGFTLLKNFVENYVN